MKNSLDIPDDLTLVEAGRLAVLAANKTEQARFNMRPFIVWLRDNYSEYVRPISENAWLLKEYFPHCARNYRNGGIGIKQRAAKSFIGFLEEQGWSKGVVCPTIMTASRNPRCVPTSKVKAAIAEAEPCLSRMLTFMVETGCRPSEARRLSWGHVHFPDDLPLKANGIGLAKFIDHRYYTEHQKVDVMRPFVHFGNSSGYVRVPA